MNWYWKNLAGFIPYFVLGDDDDLLRFACEELDVHPISSTTLWNSIYHTFVHPLWLQVKPSPTEISLRLNEEDIRWILKQNVSQSNHRKGTYTGLQRPTYCQNIPPQPTVCWPCWQTSLTRQGTEPQTILSHTLAPCSEFLEKRLWMA